MQIMNQALQGEIEQLFIKAQVIDECAVSIKMIEIAKMMADKGVAIAAESNGAFQLPSERGNRYRTAHRQGDWLWRVAARAADGCLGAGHNARHGVVAANTDGPIMHEKQIRNSGETFQGVTIVISNWLVGPVAAGHDKRDAVYAAKKKMVHRSVGKHDAECRIARRDLILNRTRQALL